MKHGEYRIHLAEALTKANIENTLGTVVPGDQMSAVALHLPTEVLRAVVKNEVMYDPNERGAHNPTGIVPFHKGWFAACDDELTDRILTENLDEREEQK